MSLSTTRPFANWHRIAKVRIGHAAVRDAVAHLRTAAGHLRLDPRAAWNDVGLAAYVLAAHQERPALTAADDGTYTAAERARGWISRAVQHVPEDDARVCAADLIERTRAALVEQLALPDPVEAEIKDMTALGRFMMARRREQLEAVSDDLDQARHRIAHSIGGDRRNQIQLRNAETRMSVVERTLDNVRSVDQLLRSPNRIPTVDSASRAILAGMLDDGWRTHPDFDPTWLG